MIFFLPFPAFSPTCLPTSVPCVTLVTAKKQHRCWNASATHTREKTSSSTCLPYDRLSLCDCFAISIFHISMYWKKIMHFSPIFSLFGAISPHILIGRCETNIQRSSYFVSLSRRKPIHQIYSPLCLFWHYYFVVTFSSLLCARKQIEDEGKKGTKEKAASKHGALTRPFRAKRL